MSPFLSSTLLSNLGPKHNENAKDILIRPSHLSTYPTQHADKCCHDKINKSEASPIEDGIRYTRINLMHVGNEIQAHFHKVDDYYQLGKQHASVLVEYLNEPDHTLPRAGAISLGAASGYIFGLRHGSIRRFLYTGMGTAVMAIVCYPKDMNIYANIAFGEAREASKICYNFAFGVKPGDKTQTYPQIPSTSTELRKNVLDLFQSVKQKIASATITGSDTNSSK